MMLRSLLRLSRVERNVHIQIRDLRLKAEVGVKAPMFDHRESVETCLYPLIQKLNVETQNGCHTFNIPVNYVMHLIHLRAIQMPFVLQYCHYMADLARSSEMPEDRNHYATQCGHLMDHVLCHEKELPQSAVIRLMTDVADTTKENAVKVLEVILTRETTIPLKTAWSANLFGSLCKFGLWKESCQFLRWISNDMFGYRFAEHFVSATIKASEEYKTVNAIRGKQIKTEILDNLKELCRLSRISRIQFLTEQKEAFINALKDLEFDVTESRPKLSGRCVNCKTVMPLYQDEYSTKTVNASIKSLIFEGSDKDLYLNTDPRECRKFIKYLEDLHEIDRRPLDCVIDGLNLSFRSAFDFGFYHKKISDDIKTTHRRLRPESQAHVLINTIIQNDMLKMFKKILVVGRTHMMKWPYVMDFFRNNNIHFYASQNSTKDDILQLYAATLNPKTVLITNDFFRDHLAKLQGQDRKDLERWIDTHQVWIETHNLKALWPTPYEKIVHYDDTQLRFHLPVMDFSQLDRVGILSPPHLNNKITTWLCVNAKM